MPGAIFAPWRRRRRRIGAITLPPPDIPNTPSPANAATAYYTLLSWLSARATSFDIYLDTGNPPTTLVASRYPSPSFVPTLTPGTTYYWRIIASNDGGPVTGPVWSFTAPSATAVHLAIAGTVVSSTSLLQSLVLHDVLGSEPNSGSLTCATTAPALGASIRIGLGTLDDAHLLFGGEIQDFDQTYFASPAKAALYPVTLIDHTFRLNKRRPFGTWVNVSASTIARTLVAAFATGFTANHVQDNLPAVSINFDGSQDFMSCLRNLATAISDSTNKGKTKVDYTKDVWLYLTYTGEQPDPLDRTHPPLNEPAPIRFSLDLSQMRTRVYGKGHGEALLSDVSIGEFILPIADAVMFNASGGKAIASTTPDGAQTQILTYTGVRLGGSGSLVGPGAAPSVAPTVATTAGTELGAGVYQYAYTDVTAAGETIPSPIGSITTGPMAAPAAPQVAYFNTGAPAFPFAVGDGIRYWAVTFGTADGETAPSPTFAPAVPYPLGPGGPYAANVLFTVGPSGTTYRRIYRTVQNGSQLKLVATVADNTTTTYVDSTFDGSLGANAPTSTTALSQRVNVTGIAIGQASVTARKLYRTVVNGSQLKLLTTIADNTTTTFGPDTTVDGSLGANAPTSDTSGLTQPAGQVIAGATSLPTASAGPFSATGGWVTLYGQQTVRYTGISGNNLTGIPASGPGSITTTVIYGSPVLPAPSLTGVVGVALALAKDSSVNIWVQRDDLAAQAQLGALELDDQGNPTDGIREYTIVDERSTEARMIALCDADLAIFSRPVVAAEYYTRDPKTKAGRTATISLSTVTGSTVLPAVFDPLVFDGAVFLTTDTTVDALTPWGQTGDFTIQSVDITFDAPELNPLYHVMATSVSFTLTDLLRRVALTSS
jgi:hypothetical protein